MAKIIDITKYRNKTKAEMLNIQKILVQQKMIKLQMELEQMDKLILHKLENQS